MNTRPPTVVSWSSGFTILQLSNVVNSVACATNGKRRLEFVLCTCLINSAALINFWISDTFGLQLCSYAVITDGKNNTFQMYHSSAFMPQ